MRGPVDPVAPEAVLDLVPSGCDVIVPLANGEPVTLLDALEANSEDLKGCASTRCHALHDRPSIRGELGERIRHVSYFLSHITRSAFADGNVDLVPNHFSEVPRLLRGCTSDPVVLAAASPIDRHGYFSLGTNADYVAPFIGKVPFFLEANHRMPRTFGRNQIHASQITGWVEVDRPLVETPPPPIGDIDRRIAGYIAERVPDGATIQRGSARFPTRSCRRCAATATSACTPSCSATGSSTSSRPGWSPAPARR